MHYDAEGRFEVVNDYLASFYGTTPEALVGERSELIPRIREEWDGDPYEELLNGERAELERRNERLDEFASLVSHDLQNPLSVAEGRLGLAREECQSEHLDAVGRAHERMRMLIDDMLALARGGAQAADVGPVSLAEVVPEYWGNAAGDEATLTVETGRTVLADASRLQQLFANLFRNAVAYAGPDVTVTVGDLDGGFYVADDGPGVPADERERVFETGYSGAGDGHGLGLAIVREVVEAHGWDVALTESVDGGARFEFTGVEGA